MKELLDHYQAQAMSRLSSLPWLTELQQQALNELKLRGFPDRFDEEWKYTKVDDLLKHEFVSPRTKAVSSSPVVSDAPLKQQVQLITGEVFINEALASSLPQDAIVLPLQQALIDHADKLKMYLEGQASAHGFQALNTAMMHSGVFIYLPKGLVLDEPILLTHWQDQDQQATHVRHVIVADEGARASLVEEYRGLDGCCYLTNTLTNVFTHARARLDHYKIQRESLSAYHIGHLSVRQEAHSQFNSHSLSLGGKLVRSDIHIHLLQEQASCLMNGIYTTGQGQHIDHHTTVEHQVPNCQSKQDYKGILNGRSRGVFNGKVIVAKDAQHSHAQQQNKNLLLSEHAEINTKPQLEIFADDVICSHGATVGQLDEESLFYLATRGLDRQQASAYLIHAFAADNLSLIEEPALAEWIGHLLNQQLG